MCVFCCFFVFVYFLLLLLFFFFFFFFFVFCCCFFVFCLSCKQPLVRAKGDLGTASDKICKSSPWKQNHIKNKSSSGTVSLSPTELDS